MTKEFKQKNKKSILRKDFNFFSRVGLKEKAVFTKNLAIMLKSGLAVTESLDILADQASGKFKAAIEKIEKSIMAGNSLAASMERHSKFFSDFYINTIKAGETSGNLEKNLMNIAGRLSKQKELNDKIKSAMFYPLIVLILSFVMGLTMAFVVLPKITPIFIGLKIDLPLTTRALIWFSEFIKNNTPVVLTGIGIFLTFFTWLFKQKFFKPILHYLFLHLPIVNKLSRYKNLSQFSGNLEALLKSGLSIDEALRITANTVENFYYKRKIKKVAEKISQGGKLSDNLANYEKYFPKLTTSLIRVGEKSGNLEEELNNLSQIYEDEVNNAVKLIATAVEPILLIIIGVIVGGLALSIITPIYKVTGNIYR